MARMVSGFSLRWIVDTSGRIAWRIVLWARCWLWLRTITFAEFRRFAWCEMWTGRDALQWGFRTGGKWSV